MSEEIKKEAQDVELNPNFDSYRIVDDTTGEVLDKKWYGTDAVRSAANHGVSREIITLEEYKKRFGKELDLS